MTTLRNVLYSVFHGQSLVYFRPILSRPVFPGDAFNAGKIICIECGDDEVVEHRRRADEEIQIRNNLTQLLLPRLHAGELAPNFMVGLHDL